MSAKLMGQAFEYDLAPRLKLLLLAIADHANDDGLCYPSQKRLAVKVACSVRQIRNLIATLVSDGLVEIVERGNGRGKATLYQLPWATELKAEKAEISTLKAETAIAAQPSVQPSTESPRQSEIDSSSPPQAAFRTTVTAFYEAPQNRKVGALIDMAASLGIERSSIAAKIIKDFGAGKRIVDAVKDAASEARGDPWPYMLKELANGQESQFRNRRLDPNGRAGDDRQLVAQGIAADILTEEEARSLLAARARAEGGGGSGEEAPPDAEEPLRGR